MSPGANQRWQAGDGAHRVATTAHALQAIVHADGGRLAALKAAAVVTCQGANLFSGDAADLGGTLRRPLQRVYAQRVPTQRVLGDVVVVQPVVDDEFIHQRQRQRGVSAWAQRDVFVALVSGFALARIYTNEFCAIALGHLGVAPEMQVAGNGVAAPDDDEFGLCKKLHPRADLAPQCLHHAFAAGSSADGALQERGTELVEETRSHALGLDQTHGAGIAVGLNGLGCIRPLGANGSEFLCNVIQRLVPANPLKLT